MHSEDQELGSRQAVSSLLQRSLAGDQGAYSQLFSRHAQQLLAYVTLKMGRALRRHVEAEDVLQEVYLRLFQRLTSFDSERGTSFHAWMLSVAKHVLQEMSRHYLHTKKRWGPTTSIAQEIDGSRFGRKTVVLELPSDDPTPSRIAISTERVERIFKILRELPEKEQVIVWDLLFEGLSRQEVAAKHKVSLGTISKYLARAMIRLGKEVSRG